MMIVFAASLIATLAMILKPAPYQTPLEAADPEFCKKLDDLNSKDQKRIFYEEEIGAWKAPGVVTCR